MLTDTDLQKIGELIDSKLDTKLRETFQRELKPINKALKKLDKDLGTINDFYDREVLDLDKRVIEIERHLGFPTNNLI